MPFPRREGRRAGGPAVLAALLALALPACFPYTSAYKPDPTARTTFLRVDPAAPAERSSSLSVERLPSRAEPFAPLEVRGVRRATGPALRVTRNTEQRYKDYWAPGLIPLGILGVVEIPFMALLSPIIDHGKTDNQFTVFGGMNAKGCEPNGFALASCYYAVGHMTTCEAVGEPRVTEEASPAGTTVTEEQPIAALPLRVRLLADGAALPGGMGARRAVTGEDGRASLPLAPLFAELPPEARTVEVEATAEGEGIAAARAALDGGLVEALLGPVREERLGDGAVRDGNGLLALDHYAKAMRLRGEGGSGPDLFGKLASTYRSLPVKPPVPEEVRRLLVQAEALAKEGEAGRAARKLEEALGQAPWLPSAWNNLAVVRAMEKDYGRAIRATESYLLLSPEGPEARQAKDRIYEWETLLPAAPAAGSAPPAEGTAPAAGVGISLREMEGLVRVVSLVPGGPAERGGVQAGDVVEAVGGRSTAGLSMPDVVSLCRGQAGSIVELRLRRPLTGERLSVSLERAPLAAPSARGSLERGRGTP